MSTLILSVLSGAELHKQIDYKGNEKPLNGPCLCHPGPLNGLADVVISASGNTVEP